MSLRHSLALFCLAAVASGCSATGAVPFPTAGSGAGAFASRAELVPARFRITIPKRHRARRPSFVSPSTQGMTIAITGPVKANVVAGLTPSSPGCTSGLASTVCRLTYKLKPGKYTATIVTYDAVSCTTTCTIPPGAKRLSAAQRVAFKVVAGDANAINVILAAVVASLKILPSSSNSVLNAAHGIDLLGTAARSLIVEAFDADSNAIVGSGAPVLSVAQTSGTLPLKIVKPSSSSPNVFSVTPPAAYSANTATLTVTASFAGQSTNGCAQAGAICKASAVFDMKELLAVASTSGNGVDVFAVGETSPYATIAFGVAHPTAVAFDAAGELLVANCLQGCANTTSIDSVAIFSPPYSGVPTFITDGVYGPQSMLLSSSGDLFVGNCVSCRLGGTDSVSEYAPPFGTGSAPIATASNGIADPIGMALDAAGNLWVASCATCAGLTGDSVTSYAKPYTGAPTHTLFRNVAAPSSIAIDTSGNVFVANTGGTPNVTDFIAPSYTDSSNPAVMTTIGTVGTYTLTNPTAVLASGTTLFIADNNGGAGELLRCGPPFALGGASPNCTSALDVAGGIDAPNALLLDAAGNAFVANGGTSNVAQLSAPSFSTFTTLTPGNTPNAMAILP